MYKFLLNLGVGVLCVYQKFLVLFRETHLKSVSGGVQKNKTIINISHNNDTHVKHSVSIRNAPWCTDETII